MEPESPDLLSKGALLKGWLKKQGGLMKQWHRRWFILNGQCLFYFYNEDDRNPQGTIFLHKKRIIVPPANPADPDKFLFEISDPGEGQSAKGDNSDSLVLCAGSEEERQRWVKALRYVLYADKGGAIFGQALEETMKYEHQRGRDIPYIIEQCVEYLSKNGLEVEGIFRMPGRVAMVRDLVEKFDSGLLVDLEKIDTDVHTVASLLKLYLRELPTSIIPSGLYQAFMNTAMRSLDAKTKEAKMKQVEVLKELIPKLPDDNYYILKYLCRFLKMVSQNAKHNKMDNRNLGLVLGCNIIRHMDNNPQILVATTDLAQELVCMLLEHFDVVFVHDPVRLRAHNVPVDDLLRVSTISPDTGVLKPMPAPRSVSSHGPGAGAVGSGAESENLRLLAELDLSDPKNEERQSSNNAAPRRSATMPSHCRKPVGLKISQSDHRVAPNRSAPRPRGAAPAGEGEGETVKSPPLRPAPVPPKRRTRAHRRQQVRSEDLTSLAPSSPVSPGSPSGTLSSFGSVFPAGEKYLSSSDSLCSSSSTHDNAAVGLDSAQTSGPTPGETSGPVANGSNQANAEEASKVLPSIAQMDLQIEALKDELQRTKNHYEVQVRALKNELLCKKREHEAEMKALTDKLEAEQKSRGEAVERIILLQSQLQRYQMEYGELK